MRILLTIMFIYSGCSIGPEGKKKPGKEEIVLPPGVYLDFVSLQRPFKTQDFQNERFLLDGQSLNNDRLRLLSSSGVGWSVTPKEIDTVELTDTGVLFDPLNLVMFVDSKYLWRMELDKVLRTVEPVDTTQEIDPEKELTAYEAKASTDELNADGQLNLIGISTDIAITRTEKEIVEYYVSPDEGIVRTLIPPPPGLQDWSSVDAKAFGICKEKCLWILGEASIYLFFPKEGTRFGEGDWYSFDSKINFPGGDWQQFVSLSMVIVPNETHEPNVIGPAFLTTKDGIFLSESGYEEVFTSRVYDDKAEYTWENVADLAKDYCIGCHTGYLGLASENTWKERKDIILKYILPEEKEASYTMPKQNSSEYKYMTDDERKIMASWLRSKGADANRAKVKDVSGPDGPKKFSLSNELLAIIDGGYGNCLSCHGAGVDDMRLKSWWLNPVRNNRSGVNGKEASIASLRTNDAAWKMPRGVVLNETQISNLENLFNAIDLSD